MSGAQLAGVIRRMLQSTPQDAPHRPIRSMAAETGLPHMTIRRIRPAAGLQPHRSGTFRWSTDPLLGDKVQGHRGAVLGAARPVVPWVDGKSHLQAGDREQPVLPVAAGGAGRWTHTCVRNGTTPPLAAPDIATGAITGKCCTRHRAGEFPDFL